MAKFVPGQRVRLVHAKPNTIPIGTEGVIQEGCPCNKENRCWMWLPKGFSTPVVSKGDQLEPIIEDKDSSTWEEMGFHPLDFEKQKVLTHERREEEKDRDKTPS